MNDSNTAKLADSSFFERKPKMAAHKYKPLNNSDNGDLSEWAILSSLGSEIK